MSLSIQKDTPLCMKSMLSTILRVTLILQLLYHGRLCLLIAFDRFYNYARKCNVFKQSVYLNIYFFFLSRHFARAKCWGISVKHCEFTEVFILRCLMITCRNKTSKGLALKLTSDLIQPYQQHWHYRKCLIVSLRLFSTF